MFLLLVVLGLLLIFLKGGGFWTTTVFLILSPLIYLFVIATAFFTLVLVLAGLMSFII